MEKEFDIVLCKLLSVNLNIFIHFIKDASNFYNICVLYVQNDYSCRHMVLLQIHGSEYIIESFTFYFVLKVQKQIYTDQNRGKQLP